MTTLNQTYSASPCAGCGSPTPPQSLGQPRKYCSDAAVWIRRRWPR